MIKKIAKIVLWLASILVAIILIALLVIRILFPPQKLKALAVAQLEAAIDRKVEIGAMWFNPFKGFSINDVVVFEYPRSDTAGVDTTAFFHSRSINLKYRFLSLLKREIEINSISIDQPEINLNQDQSGHWNFESLFVSDTTIVIVKADTGDLEISLPLAIKLKQFSLNNFTANIFIDQVDTIYTIRTGGVSFNVDDLFLPRQSFDEFKKSARADLHLFSDQQPWHCLMKASASPKMTELSANIQLDLTIKISGLQHLYSDGEIAITNLILHGAAIESLSSSATELSFPQFVSVFYNLESDAEQGRLSLAELEAKIGEETVFNIKGTITDFLNQPRFYLEVAESEINLSNLISLILPLLPDTVQQQRNDIAINGLASFRGTKIAGNAFSENLDDALTVNLLFSLDNFYAAYVDPKINLSNLKIRSKFTEIHNINGVQQADIWINASLDSFYLATDTLTLGYGGFNWDVKSALDADFMPDSIRTSFSIENFFEVPLDFSFNFKSIAGLDSFRADGQLTIDQLPLSNLPESTTEGLIDIALNLHAETLDQIKLAMRVASDMIKVQTEPEPLIFYPMEIYGDALLSTDPSFAEIELNQLTMDIDNFATALMHGDINLNSPSQIHLFVDNLNVDHEQLLSILPEQLLEGYETLKVTGSSKLTSNIAISLPENQEAIIDAKGKIFVKAGVEYPDAYFSLKSIDGTVNFASDGDSGIFDLEAMVDSIIFEDVRDEPLRNMPLVGKGRFPDLETLKLDSAIMLVPDLMTKIFLKGQIDSLSGNAPARFDGLALFNTEDDTVSLLNYLRGSGTMALDIKLFLVNDVADIKGLLNIDHLDLVYEDIAQIESIAGVIHFSEKYDIEKETLIESSPKQSFFDEAGSYYYDLLRPYYQQSRDQFSYLRIGKIQAMDYYASDITFDIFISNERIEIPRFALNAYDGNMSGSFYANLHEGTLDQIEWKVKANLSQLNSAKLIPSRRLKAKGAELNMNLELSGSGIDPASQMEVAGYLYVTKIGPQFTDNVLRSLDPKGTDKSIQDTRRLLNWGYKPRLLSFEIKHGNLYPTIHLVKGKLWTRLIPLNLSGGKIELARIPVKFFMTNMMTESQ